MACVQSSTQLFDFAAPATVAGIETGHKDLYKTRFKDVAEFRQTERRQKLLSEQRSRRADEADKGRCFDELRQIVRRRPYKAKHARCQVKLQLSEWLYEVPDDLPDWFVKPCPKGYRSLVVAADGRTQVYNKRGQFVCEFRSSLPGDLGNNRNAMTILDCVYVPSTKEYHVLDVISYGSHCLTECDAEFRSFWLDSRFGETDLGTVSASNEFAFRLVGRVNCADNESFNELVAMHPLWPNDEPALDGFLFYQKHAVYTHGQTPLVGWLFPFMLPEFFHVPHIHPTYLTERPPTYVSHAQYFQEFDEDLRQKRRARTRNRRQKMDTEECDHDGADASEEVIVDEMKELESGSNGDEDYM